MTAPECTFTAQLVEVNSLHPEIIELVLSCPEGFTWNAGDYLWLENAKGIAKPFSIASLPSEKRIRLQVAHVESICDWLDDLLDETQVHISIASNQFHWPKGNLPLVLFAGGTGITPIMALLKSHLAHSHRRVVLYWGVRNPSLAYLKLALDTLTEKYPHFSYQLVLSADTSHHGENRLHGLIPDLIQQNTITLPQEAFDVMICGPWAMVTGIKSVITNDKVHSLQH